MASENSNNAVNAIFNINDLAELEYLNKVLVSRIRDFRARKASRMRYTLSEGDKVSWRGKRGFSTGVVRRVKRKNAEVINDSCGTLWNVPMNMLEVIDA